MSDSFEIPGRKLAEQYVNGKISREEYQRQVDERYNRSINQIAQVLDRASDLADAGGFPAPERPD